MPIMHDATMRFTFVASGPHRLATSVDLPADDHGAGPWPTVIVVHGLTGHRLGKSYHLVEFGRRLAERGIACVRFDQSGCGESTGRFEDHTIPRMIDDVRAIRDWVGEQAWADADRLGYVGISLGALPTVAVEADRPAGAVALWAPVFDMPRVFARTAKTGLRAVLAHRGWMPYRGLRIGRSFVEQLGAVTTGDVLAQSDAPLLVFHSRCDDVVGFAEGEAYVACCERIDRPCRFEPVDDADHDFSDLEHRERLLGTTVAFFASHLLDIGSAE